MNKAQLSEALVTALKPTVSNRVYRNVFPQPPAVPVWPAIRYAYVSVAANPDICGDGGEEVANYRIQIDVVRLESDGMTAFSTLTASVKAALAAADLPMQWDSEFDEYDPETKTTRLSMDYLVFLSTPEVTP